jgi:hypothetical protein
MPCKQLIVARGYRLPLSPQVAAKSRFSRRDALPSFSYPLTDPLLRFLCSSLGDFASKVCQADSCRQAIILHTEPIHFVLTPWPGCRPTSLSSTFACLGAQRSINLLRWFCIVRLHRMIALARTCPRPTWSPMHRSKAGCASVKTAKFRPVRVFPCSSNRFTACSMA